MSLRPAGIGIPVCRCDLHGDDRSGESGGPVRVHGAIAPLATDGPGAWNGQSVDVSQFEEDMVYLVLHGLSGADMQLVGTSESNWRPVAVNSSVISGSWQAPAVAFGAVCWGGLVVDKIARLARPGRTITPRLIEESYPLSSSTMGPTRSLASPPCITYRRIRRRQPSLAHRFTVFSGTTSPGWGWPGRGALPGQGGVIGALRVDTHRLAKAEELKAYWAATCIGFGW